MPTRFLPRSEGHLANVNGCNSIVPHSTVNNGFLTIPPTLMCFGCGNLRQSGSVCPNGRKEYTWPLRGIVAEP